MVIWDTVFCAECGMNVHHKCQKKVANLCGVNQKLMAEALAIIESKQQVRFTNFFTCFRPTSDFLLIAARDAFFQMRIYELLKCSESLAL